MALPITGRCQETSKSRAPGGREEERDEIFGPEKDCQGSEKTLPRRHHRNSPLPRLPFDQSELISGADSIDQRRRGSTGRRQHVD